MIRFRSIKAKLLASFGILCAIILLQGAVSLGLNLRMQAAEAAYKSAQNTAMEVSEIVTSHYEWLNNMTLSVYTGAAFTGSLDPTGCSLGQWLAVHGEVREDYTLSILLDNASAPHRIIHESAAQLLTMAQEGASAAELEALYNEVIKPHSLTTIGYLEEVKERQETIALAAEATLAAQQRYGIIVTVFSCVLSVTIGLLASYLLIRGIVPPVVALTEAVKKLSLGQTGVAIDVRTADEIGLLSTAFNEMQHSEEEQASLAADVADKDLTRTIPPRSSGDRLGLALNKMVENVREMLFGMQQSSQQVAEVAKQMADNASHLAQGTSEQASTVEELSSTLTDITAKVSETSAYAVRSAQLNDQIRDNAEMSVKQMGQMIEAMEEINRASRAIAKVVRAIDDIAFQTNILSINASVEAARAGTYGQGFAVVAEQVRLLSAKSSQVLERTSGLIQNCMEKAEVGSEAAAKTAASLESIRSDIEQGSEMSITIANSSQAQAGAIDQISQGIDMVSQVIQQHSALSEETAANAQEMYAQSALLAGIIAQFKLEEHQEAYVVPPTADLPPTVQLY